MFFSDPTQTVLENCGFDYRYNMTAIPTVLDEGETILLANMVKQKSIRCKHNAYLKTPFPHHNCITVNRSLLCECEIDASLAYVLRSLSACDHHNRDPLTVTMAVNLAFQIFRPILSKTETFGQVKGSPGFTGKEAFGEGKGSPGLRGKNLTLLTQA